MRRTRSSLVIALLVGLLFALLDGACGQPAPPPQQLQKVSLSAAPAEGDVAPFVASTLAAAKQKNRKLLVYVGAKWCEPCKRFHDAVTQGKFDARFPQLDLVEFDLDRDESRLRAAGYTSEYIPLFARPDDNGRGSGRQFAGSIKGEAALGDLERKLTSLLQ